MHEFTLGHPMRSLSFRSGRCTQLLRTTGGYATLKLCRTTTGRVAQLGERLVRNEEAGGSNPPSSTTFQRYTVFGKQ